MIKIISILFLNFLLLIINCFAQQQNHFNHYTTRDGLSQSSVYSITQDDIGFMWFATEDGLNKFDGNEFTVYRPIDNDTTSLSDLGIRKVYKDKTGNIWVLSQIGNLNLYNFQKNNFRRFLFSNKFNKKIKIISLTEDANNVLWVASTKGELFYYDSKNKKFVQKFFNENIQKQLESIHLLCLLSASDGTLWLGTWEGLLNISTEGSSNSQGNQIFNKLKWFTHSSSDPNSLGGNMVFDIDEDGEGNIWVASVNGGVSVFLKSTKTFKTFKVHNGNKNTISSNRIMNILIDSRKKIWIGTLDKGLDLYDTQTDTFTHFAYDPLYTSSFSIGAVMSIFEDKSGGIWIGTNSGGVNRFDPLNQNFTQYQHIPGNPNSISPNTVLSICEDREKNLYVGTDGGGLNIKEKKSSSFKSLLQNPKYGSNTITTIYEDRKGNMWIGTDPGVNSQAGVLIKYNKQTKKFIYIKDINIKIGGISSMLEDKFGELWITTYSDGLHRYNPITRKEIIYKYNPDDNTSISSNSLNCVYEDSYGNLWFGSIVSGLILFNRKTNSFSHFIDNPSNISSIGSNTVWCIIEDKYHNLWIGTWGGGINKFNLYDKIFTKYTFDNSLTGNIVYGILPDDKGNLWLSTNKGLSKFNPFTGEIKNFDQSNGLLINDFSAGALFKTKDGKFYFGGNSGLVSFYPKNIKENKFIPNVVITDFLVFDKPFNQQNSILFTKEIKLNYNQNFFTIEFASLDFTSPGKNQFEYKLEGIDKDWIKSNGICSASYTDITNGNYKFRLKGSNSSGKFNPKETILNIIITPPFWKTWWFRLIILSVLIILLYYAHRYRLNKLLEVERTRNKIARDLHDEISATITGIAYFSEAIDREIGDNKTPMIKKLISLIHESATDAQESMSDIIWSINPENDKWEIILPKFRRFASDICESKGINYKIEIPEVFPIKSFDMERRRNFWLVFKEMVTNAVKHSQCRNLEITIFLSDNKINLIVSDDGKGFNLEKIKKGNGVNNIYLRSKNLNGDIKLETSPEKGTKWSLSIPV
ncbi:MAG: hypothetical protein STSR0008_23280 [Ignavibacterium sp.]